MPLQERETLSPVVSVIGLISQPSSRAHTKTRTLGSSSMRIRARTSGATAALSAGEADTRCAGLSYKPCDARAPR
jgi:hypothetical protein